MQITIYKTVKSVDDRLKVDYCGQMNNETTEKKIELNTQVKMQTILGFGGAFTEAAAYTYSKLSQENKQRIINAYFNPETGIGYELGRIAITSCDFSFGDYSYADDKSKNLDNFTIEHDEKWLLPMMRDAKNMLGKDIMLFGALWSPPVWMKDNNDMMQGRLENAMAGI